MATYAQAVRHHLKSNSTLTLEGVASVMKKTSEELSLALKQEGTYFAAIKREVTPSAKPDNTHAYNVWRENADDSWTAMLNCTVSIHTAETIAALLAYENNVSKALSPYLASIGRPSTVRMPSKR